MTRGKKSPAGHRGGDARDRHAARGSDDLSWDRGTPEDDPLRDLRPEDEETLYPVSDDYVWPDTSEHEDDD